MAKNVYTNLDLNGNAALNVVLGNLSSDPLSASEGYVYYNTTKKNLRTYINNGWVDIIGISDGKILKIVQSLPATGEANVIYLLQKNAVDPNAQYYRYSSYMWSDNSYHQISGYNVDWNEISNKPDLLDCEVQNIGGADNKLILAYN
jgi:hypothetical protein